MYSGVGVGVGVVGVFGVGVFGGFFSVGWFCFFKKKREKKENMEGKRKVEVEVKRGEVGPHCSVCYFFVHGGGIVVGGGGGGVIVLDLF